MNDIPTGWGPLDSGWPWPFPLPGTRLVTTRFDHGAFDDAAFSRCGIALPDTLRDAVAKRRAEFLAGRLCARRALLELDGREAIPGIGEDRAPRWPADCVGSITHSNGWAAALVAQRRDYLGLGLDAERLLSAREGERFAGRILTPREAARLAGLPAERVGLTVTATFSLKESLFKALYPLVGRTFHFGDAELVAWDDAGAARLRLLSDLHRDWPAGREIAGGFCVREGRLLSLVAVAAPG